MTATVGALALTSNGGGGDTAVDPSVRIGQFAVGDDQKSLVFIGGVAFDTASGNYVGSLYQADVATPTIKSAALLTGVSEMGPVVSRSLFVNAPKASTPGVYFVKF